MIHVFDLTHHALLWQSYGKNKMNVNKFAFNLIQHIAIHHEKFSSSIVFAAKAIKPFSDKISPHHEQEFIALSTCTFMGKQELAL